MIILRSLQCWPLLQSNTLIDFVCFVLVPADRSFPEPYADLPYCPDDRALRRHIHSISPLYTEVFSSLLDMEDGRIQMCKLTGCKNWAMVIIRGITILDEWKKESHKRGKLSLRELATLAASIEDILHKGVAIMLRQSISGQSDPCCIQSLGSRAVTHIFACSTLVYHHVVLSAAHPELPEIRESVLETIKAFQSLPDPLWVRNLV
jgi:C6 transcription factor Pro1